MSDKTSKKYISMNTVNKVGLVFEEKGWTIDEENKSSSLFSRFFSLLANFTPSQQDLIIELTYRFERIEFNDYKLLILKILTDMNEKINYFHELRDIFIMPLVDDLTKNKIKSSALVSYLFQSPEIKYFDSLSKINFKIRNEITSKEINKINESPKVLLLLVDDFIGSGETAINSFNYHKNSLKIKENKIIIGSLVSSEVGRNKIKKEKIRIFSGKIITRGITDYYKGQNLKKNQDIMKSIESFFSVKSEFEMGYGQSEALISLIRTPSNTFSVFWKDSKTINAPFPRGG